MTTQTNKNTSATANATATETATATKKGNNTMKTTATIALISLPESLQQTYTNYRLFINEYNEIIECTDISDYIQIVWIDTDQQYFITTYKAKAKKTIKGSYGTSVTQTKDSLRNYLIRPILTQKGWKETLRNNQTLELILKDEVYIDFNVQKNLSEKGNAYNTYTVS